MKLDIDQHCAYAYTGTRVFDPAQPTAVFIHGAANDHSVWALQSRYFAYHGWNVLALDLPGHGHSEGPVRTSIAALTEWVAAFLDAMLIKGATLIGHSMGSLVALELAAQRPDLVARLALVGTAVPMAVGDALLDAALHDEDRARRMIVEWSFAPNSQIGNAHAAPGMWLPGAALALMRRMQPGVLHTDLSACKAYANGLLAATRVSAPALVLSGGKDMMTPPKATHAVLAALPDARAVLIAAAGHSLLAETPSEVLTALWQFANQSAPASLVLG